MNESMGINGEVRILDDFTCTAICPDVKSAARQSRGENAGFRMTETQQTAERLQLTQDDLRELTTSQLVALVEMAGSSMHLGDRRLFRDLLVERLNQLQEQAQPESSDLGQVASTSSN